MPENYPAPTAAEMATKKPTYEERVAREKSRGAEVAARNAARFEQAMKERTDEEAAKATVSVEAQPEKAPDLSGAFTQAAGTVYPVAAPPKDDE